jgi:ATP-dependent protease ClpP protease subunit
MQHLDYCAQEDIHPTIYICSDGGDVECAAALVDKILEMEASTYVLGKAYSAAAIILAAGYERFAQKNACVMFHPCSYLSEDDHVKHKAYVEFSEKTNELLYRTICENCGMTTRQATAFIKKVNETVWMTAKEAKKQKIVTTIR